ncbi:MAG TPA: hypothetical protein VL137_14575, partial [Polyangiaceae bacterium]|nr:hypothetical protein [Polyangiaceae bacterium]
MAALLVHTPEAIWLGPAVGIPLFAVGIICFLARRATVTLFSDRIVSRSLLQLRSVRLVDIGGWRISTRQQFVLFALGGKQRLLTLSLDFAKNDDVSQWAKSLPNLMERDYANTIERIAGDAHLGATREERLANHARLGKLVRVLLLLSVPVVIIWIGLFPKPYALALWTAAVFPLIPLMLLHRFRSSLTFDDQRDGRHSVGSALLAASFALALRAVATSSPVNHVHVLVVTVLSLGVAAIMVKAAFPEFPRGEILSVAAAVAIYLGSGAMLINQSLDTKPSCQWQAPIVEKCPSRKKDGSPVYNLTLTPVGPNGGSG